MSPEELSGRAPEARSDIFALGAVMYEMMTGRQAARGRPRSVPVPTSESGKGVPKDLDAIISKALASDVDKRYQSAATLAAELRALAAILDARAAEAEAAFEPPRAHRRRGQAVVAVILLLVIAGLAFWIWRSGLLQ
jgi:serine/threonine-protein kinase